MKDRIKQVGAVAAGLVVLGVVAKGCNDVVTNRKPEGSASPSPTAEFVDPSLSVAGGQEVVPTHTPEQSVVISTQPPVDSFGVSYKGSESCRIVAATGEIFYIRIGVPSMNQGNVCLGRDGNGINWWLANEAKLGDLNRDGLISTALVHTSN